MRTVKRWFSPEPIGRPLVLAQLDSVRKSASAEHRRAARAQLLTWKLPRALDSVIVFELATYVAEMRPRSTACRSIAGSTAASGAIPNELQDVIELIGLVAHRDQRTAAERLRGATSPHIVVPLSRVDLRGITRAPVATRAPLVSSLDLRGARLDSACLADARLPYALLDGADLQRAELPGANLTSASLVHARFNHAQLPNAILTFANLRCAKLGNANVTGVDFSKASLEWAYFGGATLKGILHWDDVRGLDSAYVADTKLLSESDRQTALRKGGMIDSPDDIVWTQRAESQMLPDSICRLPPVAADTTARERR